MIEYVVWREGIIGICGLLSSENTLKTVWIDKKELITSVTSFDELYEQIFDDLDADNMLAEFGVNKTISEGVFNSYSLFFDAIKRVDSRYFSDNGSVDQRILLKSGEWQDVINASKGLLEVLGNDE